MRWYKADLHIHTILSPCADLSMGPRDIVRKAVENGIEIIAITDHNSCENVRAVTEAAAGTGVTVIPGMEIHTREEAHIICLFSSIDAAEECQKIIYDHLAAGDNDPEWFGRQYVVDAEENIIRECHKMLAMPTNLGVRELFSLVNDFGGFAYPAHIDRKSNSLLVTLGFIPHDLPVHALEIAKPFEQAAQELRYLKNSSFSIIRSSDAHYIEQFGEKFTYFKLQQPTLAEIRMAIEKKHGRDTALPVDCRDRLHFYKGMAVNG